jgi:hypothetical protein
LNDIIMTIDTRSIRRDPLEVTQPRADETGADETQRGRGAVTRLTSFRFGRVQARETTKTWATLPFPTGTCNEPSGDDRQRLAVSDLLKAAHQSED